MKLLQVPTLELEARIKQELEANPALEEGAEREELDDLDNSQEETSEALEEFDFEEYLDDETPDYQLDCEKPGRGCGGQGHSIGEWHDFPGVA